MYVDDQRRYVYCLVSKVACTSWKRVALMLTGNMTVNRTSDLSKYKTHNFAFSDQYIGRLNRMRPADVEYRVKNYFKFMFVRHPFERLVSAYRDKLTRRDQYNKMFGVPIIRNYRPNATTKALEEGNDVTFEEFVRYLLDPKTRAKSRFDRHWLSFHETCHPCHVQYDFIGKFETLQEDAAYVIKRLGGGTKFPVDDPDNKKWNASSLFVETMKRNISSESFKKLEELYAMDYAMFGYY